MKDANQTTWNHEKLREVCSLIKRGIAPKYLESGGVQVLNQKCVRNHEINYSLARRNDPEIKRVPEERLIQVGDVLVNSTGTGTLGRVAQVRKKPPEPTTVDTHVTIVRPSPGKFYSDFFGYMMIAIEDKLISGGHGASGQTELPRTDLERKFTVSFPTSLEEQQRIVAILDEAFEGLARARAHAEANLQNARELFNASLRALFADNRENWPLRNIAEVCTEFGRGKSRHRPRNDPRLYGGDMPFVQTGDLSNADHFLREFNQTYSSEGVAQSKVWPKGTVCVAIVGATIGESAILEFDACFPDSVIGMIPEPSEADSEFLDFLLQFVKADLKEAGKGSARDNINLGTFSDRLFPIPDLKAQLETVERISELDRECRRLSAEYSSKLKDLDDLRQSLLQEAFAGKLTTKKGSQSSRIAIGGEQLSCHILAIAYSRHASAGRERTFGHVKAQKVLHLAEAVCHLDLGRDPIKDAAGPSDIVQMNRAEALARENKHFEFRRRSSGGYTFVPLAAFGRAVREAESAQRDQLKSLVSLIDLLVPMDTTEAEVLTTVFAAWNNLILDGETISNEAIIRAAREDWHQDKLRIDRQKFAAAINQIKAAQIEPDGSAKYVRHKQERLL